LQGDVIAIVNARGEVEARYSYDAWGVCTIVSDTADGIANINPYRYRGYYYDAEIAKYYLQSRYYDAQTGRFVNADTSNSLQNSKSVLENNLFAYCQNDPVDESDYTGSLLTSIIKKILTGLFKGFIGQLGVDFISYLYNVLFVNSKSKFAMSSTSEYLKSIASCVISELVDFIGSAKFIIQVFTIVGSYFTKLVKGSMKTADWITLVIKLAMLILKTVLLKRLNTKKKNELKELKKYKKKKSKNTYFKKQKVQMKLKYENKGFKIDLSFDITEYVIDNFFNILASI
jgi:RHS repeat-associated protein